MKFGQILSWTPLSQRLIPEPHMVGRTNISTVYFDLCMNAAVYI